MEGTRQSAGVVVSSRRHTPLQFSVLIKPSHPILAPASSQLIHPTPRPTHPPALCPAQSTEALRRCDQAISSGNRHHDASQRAPDLQAQHPFGHARSGRGEWFTPHDRAIAFFHALGLSSGIGNTNPTLLTNLLLTLRRVPSSGWRALRVAPSHAAAASGRRPSSSTSWQQRRLLPCPTWQWPSSTQRL